MIMVIIVDIVVRIMVKNKAKSNYGLIEFDLTELDTWLDEKQKTLKDYRLAFMMAVKRFYDELGQKIRLLGKLRVSHQVDTGTYRKRIDYKLLARNL